MRRWAALLIVWGLGAVSGSMVGWTSALFTSTTSNPGNNFSAASSFCSSPGSQTVTSDKDSYIREDAPGSNSGTAVDLWVQSQGAQDRRTLVSFPLPPKPAGCLVSSAVLRLYATTVSPSRTVQAYRVAASWTETGVTWTNQPTTVGSSTTSASGSEAGWKESNVTTHVEGMYSTTNHGLLLKDAAEGAGTQEEQVYSSREGANGPELVISFAGVACSNPGSQTVLTTKDSSVQLNSPGSNFGDDPLTVKSRSGSNHRALVYFPLPAVPTDCVLFQATLRLNAFTASSGRTIEAYRAAASWTETGVSWLNQPSTAGTAATAASGNGWREWTVTAHVGAMYSGANEGFVLRDQSEDAGGAGATQTYRSREDGSDIPELVLRFG
jgi:hypothetical protein